MGALQARAHDTYGRDDHQKGKQEPPVADLHRMQCWAERVCAQSLGQQCCACKQGAGRSDQGGRKWWVVGFGDEHAPAVRQSWSNGKRQLRLLPTILGTRKIQGFQSRSTRLYDPS